MAGVSDGRTDIWLVGTAPPHEAASFHRKRPGLNHLAFRVATREDVDRFHEGFLRRWGTPMLYGSPRGFPEYTPGYYAVFFEDPDRLKLEVAHAPELLWREA